MAMIENLNTAWHGHTGLEVEEFIKSYLEQISTKIGYIYIEETGEENYLCCFADVASFNLWLADPIENANLLIGGKQKLPSGGVASAYSAKLEMIDPDNYQIATNTGKVKVKVKYSIEGDSIQEAGAVISILKSSDEGQTYSTVGNTTIAYNQEAYVDISPYLDKGTTFIRLNAKGLITGANAVAVYSVLYAVVDQYCLASNTPTIYSSSPFNLPFYIEGTAEKKLHYRVGDLEGVRDMGTSYNTQGEPIEIDPNIANLTHGVHTVESWLTFGANNTETEHRFCNFIYAPTNENSEYIDKTPLFVVTSEPAHCSNWNKITFFDYGVLNPTIDEKEFKICLAYNGVILDDYTTVISGEAGSFTTGTFTKDLRIDKSIVDTKEFVLQIMFFSDGMEIRNPIELTVDNSTDFGFPYTPNFNIDTNSFSISYGKGSDKVVYDLYTLGNISKTTASGWKNVKYNDEIIPALQLYAGSQIEIPVELFSLDTGWKSSGGTDCSITFAFDIMTNNIVNEDEAVINIASAYGEKYTGIKVYPTKACVLSRNKTDESIADVGFREGVRTHIAINIVNNLRLTGLNYMRIYVNGILSREYRYGTGDKFVPTTGTNGNIILGNTNADLTVFGMRVYKDIALESDKILQDYKASMTFLDEKITFNTANSIYDGTKIDYKTCNQLGYNTLWYKIKPGQKYPQLLTKESNGGKAKGTELVVKIYDPVTRELDVKHSGVFKGMTNKGQGTTAKSYYWWNIQSDYDDDEEIKESAYRTGVAEERSKYGDKYDIMYENGQTIFYEDEGVYYEKKSYFNSEDGVSQVNASSYEIEEGRSGITKIVGKANYASSMQSHKLGSIWFFDEMWQRLINSDRKFYYRGKESNGPIHAACYEKPFLVFYTEDIEDPTENDAVFCGFQTWGAGKGDKQTFGYHKKDDCGYLCVSGADNDKILTLFQMPWNEDIKFTVGNKSGYCYQLPNGTTPLSFEVEIGEKSDDDEAEGNSRVTLYNIFAPFVSWVNSLSPLLEKLPENLSITDLTTKTIDELKELGYVFNSAKQYWDSNYNVYYFDPKTSTFKQSLCVPETLYSDDTEAIYYIKGTKNLTDAACDKLNSQLKDSRVKTFKAGTLLEQLKDVQFKIGTDANNNPIYESFNNRWSENLSDFEKTDLFIKARVQLFATDAHKYIDVDDIILHQDVIKLLAGTDNRAKNTYYWMNPLGCKDNLIRLKGDDLDTILKTDNSGKQSKPYYIEEHDKDHENKNFWNGEHNVFYTLIERAFEKEMREMMFKMFETMASIASSVDNYFEERYFFVQRYFPAVAYNETARLLYETADLYSATDKISVAVDPMEQSLGSQLECEKEWLAKRLAMLYGYAQYGNFRAGASVQDAFKFRTAAKRGMSNITGNEGQTSFGEASTYHIEFTPYQYLYPLATLGETALYPKFDTEGWSGTRRVAKGEKAIYEWTSDTDTLCGILGMSYCASLGDMSSQPVAGNGTSLSGKRLTSFIGGNEVLENTHFRPNNILFTNCQNLEVLNLTNSDNLSGVFSDEDANMVRLRELKLKGTKYTSVSLTKTDRLEVIELPSNLDTIVISAQPNLNTFSIDGVSNVISVDLTDCNTLTNDFNNFKNTFLIPKFGENLVNSNTYTLRLNNIVWSDVSVEDLINFGKFCRTTTLFKTTGKISNFIKGSIKIIKCTEDQAWELYDLFGIECFQPNADLHIYSNTEQIFLIGSSSIAEGDSTIYEPLVLSANRKKIDYYLRYVRSDSTTSDMIDPNEINIIDTRLSAEIVGDYEILKINSIENGNINQAFTIYANHGSVTADIDVILTKRVYSEHFVIETKDGNRFAPNDARAIVLTGLNQVHSLKIIEPNGDGRYLYSTVITNITNNITAEQTSSISNIVNCTIISQPTRTVQGTLKVTCTKLIDSTKSWTYDFPIVIQNENVAFSKFTNPEIFSAFAEVDTSLLSKYAVLKTECQNFKDSDFSSVNFKTYKPTSFEEFQYFTGLTEVPNDTFKNCTELKNVILPSTISRVGNNAFYGCSALRSVTLPSNIMTIGDSAFEKCELLKDVIWEANGAALTYLGNLAFKETALTELYIPEGSNLTIGGGIVAGCSNLQKFTGFYSVNDGTVLCKNGFIKGITNNPFDEFGTLVVDPEWIGTNGGIDIYVFYNNKLIKTLDLSNCKFNMYFREHSFEDSYITNVVLADGYSIHLREYAFANTSKLNSLENFKLGAFSNTKGSFYNSAVTSVIITKNQTAYSALGNSMFENCKNLTYIDYPNTITDLGEKTFKNCQQLKEFTIKESIKNIGKDCFDGCVNLSTITSNCITAPTTVAFSFGQISTSTYAGYANQNRTDDNGDPYNKLYIPVNSTGYLSDEGIGLNGWIILVDPGYANFEVIETE